jgi:hypothetical protein
VVDRLLRLAALQPVLVTLSLIAALSPVDLALDRLTSADTSRRFAALRNLIAVGI